MALRPSGIGIGLVSVNKRVQLGDSILKRYKRRSRRGNQMTWDGDRHTRVHSSALHGFNQANEVRPLLAAVLNEGGEGSVTH